MKKNEEKKKYDLVVSLSMKNKTLNEIDAIRHDVDELVSKYNQHATKDEAKINFYVKG